ANTIQTKATIWFSLKVSFLKAIKAALGMQNSMFSKRAMISVKVISKGGRIYANVSNRKEIWVYRGR
ncbi:MAG: hypothetical protein WBB24_03545, partial [Maribacter sp.]